MSGRWFIYRLTKSPEGISSGGGGGGALTLVSGNHCKKGPQELWLSMWSMLEKGCLSLR